MSFWVIFSLTSMHVQNKNISINLPLSSPKLSTSCRKDYSKGCWKFKESHHYCCNKQISFKAHHKTFCHLWWYYAVQFVTPFMMYLLSHLLNGRFNVVINGGVFGWVVADSYPVAIHLFLGRDDWILVWIKAREVSWERSQKTSVLSMTPRAP